MTYNYEQAAAAQEANEWSIELRKQKEVRSWPVISRETRVIHDDDGAVLAKTKLVVTEHPTEVVLYIDDFITPYDPSVKGGRCAKTVHYGTKAEMTRKADAVIARAVDAAKAGVRAC